MTAYKVTVRAETLTTYYVEAEDADHAEDILRCEGLQVFMPYETRILRDDYDVVSVEEQA